MSNVTSSLDARGVLKLVAQHFNAELFDATLPAPLFSIRRHMRTLSYFSAARWQHSSGDKVGEIALRADLFDSNCLAALLLAIAQQQCHLWQHAYGRPSRPGYHNREWAERMRAIGLVPTVTGELGGASTGQRMASYPESGGAFLRACGTLRRKQPDLAGAYRSDLPITALSEQVSNFPLSAAIRQWLISPVGEWADLAVIDEEQIERKRKIKYECPRCGVAAWGGVALKISCRACDQPMRSARPSLAA